jgi:hypothetical protein
MTEPEKPCAYNTDHSSIAAKAEVKCGTPMENPAQIPCGEVTEIEAEAIEVGE